MTSSSFWAVHGWARELADEYHEAKRPQETLEVLQLRERESIRLLPRHPRDKWLEFHAAQSRQALAIEHQNRGQSRAAEAFRVLSF